MQGRKSGDDAMSQSHSASVWLYAVRQAIQQRDTHFIWRMLANGADISGCNTLLHTVITTYAQAYADLFKQYHLNECDKNRPPSVIADAYFALRTEGKEMIKILTIAGVNIHSENESGQTALHMAVSSCQVLEDILIQFGSDLNAIDQFGASILEQSIGYLMRMERLICAGADVNRVNRLGETLLHRMTAFAFNYIEYVQMLRLLLLYGADINRPDSNGRTPLHLAVQNHCVEFVRALFQLKVGAILDSIDYIGESPVEIKDNHTELERELINLNVMIDLNWQDIGGKTALMSSKCHSISALLIVFGANLSLVDAHGETALDHALNRHDLKTAALLRRAGANTGVAGLASVSGTLFNRTVSPPFASASPSPSPSRSSSFSLS